ncbi:MAG: class I SAM-dependent methyltransferase [Verrucomicrobiota bacterium]
MTSYDRFSRFYDLVMGDRADAANFIHDLIEHHHPRAQTLLEIACGTGGILGRLSESYDVTGLDRSRSMLAVARARLPHIRLFRQDMTSFHIDRRFDAIVCAFDSINHLQRFSDWKKTFRCVARHLNAGGVFIFDVNTKGKLQRLVDGAPWVKQFGRDLVVIKVNGGRGGVFAWDVKIFEHRRRDDYKLIGEIIEETAIPMRRILTSLRAYFTEVKVFDPEGARPSDRSERLYFVCKTRAK